jgi:renalase
MLNRKSQKIAVIGAGLAGAASARALTLAGHAVQVFDKSRGPGGRLATRRAEWVDAQGQAQVTQLDHGCVGLTARSEAFKGFLDQAAQAGFLAEWVPARSQEFCKLEAGHRLFVPAPDMPTLCRQLLEGAATTWLCAVDALHKGPMGWQVHANGELHNAPFDAVVLAMPPAQAAPLLGPHQRAWAQQASAVAMQPCWTLMGVADEATALNWELAQPSAGPLAWVVRNDTRPGRQRVHGQAHWVVHAQASWSFEHLEQSAAWIQQQLTHALAELLGQPVNWRYCAVHRWRYAVPPVQNMASSAPCWWDAAQSLGVCGDFFASSGAEGAWLSAQSLSSAMLQISSDAADAVTCFPAAKAVPLAARQTLA